MTIDKSRRRGGAASSTLLALPESLIIEILQRLDLESVWSISCVTHSLNTFASQVLASLSNLDLSAISLDERSLDGVLNKMKSVKNVTIDCLQLTDSSVMKVLGPQIQDLTLLKGSSLSPHVLTLIGDRCPNLRALLLELIWQESGANLIQDFRNMTRALSFLESFAVKIRGTQMHASNLMQMEFFLPETLRDLKLQSVHEGDVVHFFRTATNNRSVVESSNSLSTSILQPHFLLQRLSLVLNIISDELVSIIVNSLPNLIHLDLEDRPSVEPIYPRDLTNYGLQALGSCQHLTTISIVRSRHHHPASFKMINDMGMFLLSEGCQDLKSVTLSGFSAVTDAGYSSFLRSCQGLKKLEIRHASHLSDLTFHDVSAADCLVELRIVCCSFITSEAISQLDSSTALEVLDTSGCRSISDTCLSYISGLQTLTNINLSGAADVTDKGLATLSDGDLPITRLCLRGCKRVSDRGIANLFVDGARICKTLTSLDLGHMAGITDKSFTTIASFCESLDELCIRYCFFVTDASLELLSAMKRFNGGNRSLQKLDLFNCMRLSTQFLVLLQKHTFRGLKWVGAGRTNLESQRDDFADICLQKPWLIVCFDGCEMGCHDGWQFHKRNTSDLSTVMQSRT